MSVSDDAADFPLVASLGGTLPGGVQVEAGADLRGDRPFSLGIVIDGRPIDLSSADWPRPFPEQDGAAEAEYAGLIDDFVKAIRWQDVDRAALLEIIETHRELIAAAQI